METKNREEHIENIRSTATKKLQNSKSKYNGLILGRLLGEGGNSTCFEIENDPNLVLIALGTTGFGSGFEGSIKLAQIERDLPPDLAIAKIRAVYKGEEPLVIMEKAKGAPLHNRKNREYAVWSDRLKEIAEIPQDHYDKLVKTVRKLAEEGITNDPSKPDNIFHDKEHGFTIIDLGLTGKKNDSPCHLGVPLIHTYNLYNAGFQVNESDFENIFAILRKLKTAGDDNSKLEQDITSYMNKKNNINQATRDTKESVEDDLDWK